MKQVYLSDLDLNSTFVCYSKLSSSLSYSYSSLCSAVLYFKVEYRWRDGDVLCSYHDSATGFRRYQLFHGSMLVLVDA